MILKETLFNKELVTMFSNQIGEVYPAFNKELFIIETTKSFIGLELKERMSSVRVSLEKHMPISYIETLTIFSKVFTKTTQSHFIYGSILEYIEKNGCNKEYLTLSLEKLGEFTSSFSAEFAIRPFLNEFPQRTLGIILKWSRSDDYHKRRLASEGTRPSLPWAMNINVNYQDASKALDNLYGDSQRYVTRSVANHLNDISKIDPSFVLDKLELWIKSNKQNPKEMEYITKHSLRTLIKQGEPRTLALLGFSVNPSISVANLVFERNTIRIGELLVFAFDLESIDDNNLLIDYIVYYPSTTKRRNKKIYKLKVLKTKNREKITIKGKRSFKEISTRKIRPGVHTIEIQINGKIYLSRDFEVSD